MKNKHGLSRDIPRDVKRYVRQRCGFGCVICGASIYQYDHFEPEFSEALTHEGDGITLLCPTHHDEKTRGVLPIELVKRHNLDPTSVKYGQTSITRPYFDHIPSLALGGGMLVENTPIPVMVRGIPMIEFMAPEPGSKVARINANITSEDGKNGLRIVDNEWIVDAGVWDYEWIGQRMTIRDNNGKVSLQISIFPPKLIMVDKLRYNRPGINVTITQTEIIANGIGFTDCIASHCMVGISL